MCIVQVILCDFFIETMNFSRLTARAFFKRSRNSFDWVGDFVQLFVQQYSFLAARHLLVVGVVINVVFLKTAINYDLMEYSIYREFEWIVDIVSLTLVDSTKQHIVCVAFDSIWLFFDDWR